MKPLTEWLPRLKEPSTHAGIGVVLATVYPFIPYPYSWIVAGVAALFGFTGIVKQEKGPSAPPPPP